MFNTPGDASKELALHIARLIRQKPDAVLGLPTGNTPRLLYRELIRLHREEDLDFSRVTTFNLDEYVGLPKGHDGSFYKFMRRNFFDAVNVPPEQIHLPDGMAADLSAACDAYEEAIAQAGGIDLMVLGIGGNGHIGFNEPGTSFHSRTRVSALTNRTLSDNAFFFDGDSDRVPRKSITMGIRTILEARSCALIAFGAAKARPVADAVQGPVTTLVPASAMRSHPNAVWLLDSEAAALIRKQPQPAQPSPGKMSWKSETPEVPGGVRV